MLNLMVRKETARLWKVNYAKGPVSFSTRQCISWHCKSFCALRDFRFLPRSLSELRSSWLLRNE